MSDPVKKKEKGDLLWFKIARVVLPALATGYMKLVDFTSRKIFINQHHKDEILEKQPVAVCTFHQTIPFAAYYIGRYHGVVMVSRSWDGELLAGALHMWGWKTTRGSSSRGGKEALAEMIDIANEAASSVRFGCGCTSRPGRQGQDGHRDPGPRNGPARYALRHVVHPVHSIQLMGQDDRASAVRHHCLRF